MLVSNISQMPTSIKFATDMHAACSKPLKSQVVLLQTAHYWGNAGALLGGLMRRERGS